MKKKWYYSSSADHFGEFIQTDESPDFRGMSYAGPFDTFNEAKKDAIEQYMTTIQYCKDAIKEIRSWRKSK